MMTTPDHARASNKATPKFFTIGEIAQHLYVSPRTVHRWIANRQLATHRFGRSVRVSESDLKAFLAVHRDAN
jgi:excisionase family DNA binding protein